MSGMVQTIYQDEMHALYSGELEGASFLFCYVFIWNKHDSNSQHYLFFLALLVGALYIVVLKTVRWIFRIFFNAFIGSGLVINALSQSRFTFLAEHSNSVTQWTESPSPCPPHHFNRVRRNLLRDDIPKGARTTGSVPSNRRFCSTYTEFPEPP